MLIILYFILYMINPSSLLSLFWVTLLEPFKVYHCLYSPGFLARFICISTVTINYIYLHVAKTTFTLLISLFFLLLSSQGFFLGTAETSTPIDYKHWNALWCCQLTGNTQAIGKILFLFFQKLLWELMHKLHFSWLSSFFFFLM